MGAGELLIDSITLKLFVLIGVNRSFQPHPLSSQPRHPRHERHRNEFVTATSTTWLSRFVATIKDINAEVDFNWGPIGEAAQFLANLLLDAFDWVFEDAFEDALNSAVRDFLSSNGEKLANGAEQVLLQIANREHVLHDVRRDTNDLIIEHFDPIGDPPPRRPQPVHKPSMEPIDGPMPSDANEKLGTINHIVVVMMENRSFDHMLGYLSHLDPQFHPALGRRTDVDGLTGNEKIPLGGSVSGLPASPIDDVLLEFRPDPDHGFFSVSRQIGNGKMDGFIAAFRERLSNADEIEKSGRFDDERRIVNFLRRDQIPVYDYIAREFCVLDRWFSPFPGGIYPNRMCALAGLTTALTNSELIPEIGYLKPLTLFDLLTKSSVDWRLYEGDISFLRAFERYRINFDRILPQDDFFATPNAPLGPVTFIDPNATGAPSQKSSEDDHPPTNIVFGQNFLGRVIKRLQASPSWDKTLLIVTYDEHGGFYDHVAPPGTTVFQKQNPGVSSTLTRVYPLATNFGVRVPALVISPRVKKGSVGHHIYDHTSIIKTILQRFAPDRIGDMPDRVRQARHLGEILELQSRLKIASPPTVKLPSSQRLRTSASGGPVRLEHLSIDQDDPRQVIGRIGMPRRRPA